VNGRMAVPVEAASVVADMGAPSPALKSAPGRRRHPAACAVRPLIRARGDHWSGPADFSLTQGMTSRVIMLQIM